MNPLLKAFSVSVSTLIRRLTVGLLIAGAAFPMPLGAQTITVRLLNGKTGRPLSDKNVTLLWSPDYFPAGSVVYLGKEGVGTVKVPANAKSFMMLGGPKIGKEPYRLPFITCNGSTSETIQIPEVLNRGYVPGNTCSKKTAVPRPGEIVFWALPKPWWQLDMQ